jgi:hypothetical protein
LLVLPDDVGVGDADLEVDGVGDGVVRLSGWGLAFVGVGSVSGLLLQVFVVSSLLFFALESLGVLSLLGILLVSAHLGVVARLVHLLS